MQLRRGAHSPPTPPPTNSGILAGFFPLNLDAVVGHLDVAFRDLTSWRPLAVLDQASDALRLNRTASFVRAYDALASALGSPLRADWAHPPSAFMTGALESLAQESNRDIPSARSNASFRRTVRGLVAAASGRLEDDPRFEGVRWLCDGEPP